MTPPDICYVVRPGETNEELRYSLRSLRNLPHRRVWIAGGCPSWVSEEVGRIDFRQDYPPRTGLQKMANTRRGHRAIAEHADVAEHLVLMNDDFFITEPLPSVPVLNYGTIDDFWAYFRSMSPTVSEYMLGERRTVDWLQRYCGIAEPLCYALHVPMPVPKQALADTLTVLPMEWGGASLHLRTALGNMAQLGGAKSADVKVTRRNAKVAPSRPFFSTDDGSWAMGAGPQLRAMFPEPGPYER